MKEGLRSGETFERAFAALFPGFFEREEIRALPDSFVFAELVLNLKEPLPWTAPLPFPEGISFGLYEGPLKVLQEAVQTVEEDWVQYFDGGGRTFCAFDEGRIASFCALTDMGAAQGLHIGGPGCVGTLPAWRKKGIGLEMVRQTTLTLKAEGYDLSWIYYTGVAPWYAKLGYRTVLRWDRDGFRGL